MLNDQAQSFITRIIQEQETVIGPLAWEEASKVSGLQIDLNNHGINLEGNTTEIIEKLVAQYENLFGRASREVCRAAVRPLLSQIPADQIPAVLK